jgi:hypothetical protein
MTYGYDPNQVVSSLRAEFDQKLNQYASGLRKHNEDLVRKAEGKLTDGIKDLASIARALQSSSAGVGMGSFGQDPAPSTGVLRIEDIPGRRVPYDMLVDIPIGPDVTTEREASFTVSQEGPFVAVKRVMAFQSAMEFQVTYNQQVARYVGRSYGRYRPIHSASDLLDAQHNGISDAALWYLSHMNIVPNSGLLPTGVLGLPSSASSFRTMEFDGRVTVINEGSGFPRQRIEVPTTMWTTDQVSPQDLGALDFFERGEVVTLRVLPNHANNPAAGNVDGHTVFPAAATHGFPFLEGQYDPHEGIATPGALINQSNDQTPPTSIADDIIARLPQGIVTIGYIGYRIVQAPGYGM